MPNFQHFPEGVDEVLRKRFEAALSFESPLRIQDCLPERNNPLYLGTLEEIVAIAIEHSLRQSADERRSPYPQTLEQYLQEFPELDQSVICKRLSSHIESLNLLLTHRSLSRNDTNHAATRGGNWILSNYQLLECIGQGGMGQVYRALHVRLQKNVAIKVLKFDLSKDKTLLQRFDREMIASGQLQHANIISTFDAGCSDGYHYLVMELVDGADIEALLLKHKRFTVSEACEIARQAALGLEYAHSKGLVHRDIKPSNLMLTKEGTVKILDLGLASVSQTSKRILLDLTTSSHFLGTPLYMAPEQIDRPHEVTYAADVFGLGATLHRMLTGKSPLGDRDSSAVQVIASLARGDLTILTDKCQDVPHELASIIRSMLSIDPRERPSSAKIVATTLADFTSGENLSRLFVLPDLDSEMLDLETIKTTQLVVKKQKSYRYVLLAAAAFLAILTAVLFTSNGKKIWTIQSAEPMRTSKPSSTGEIVRWIRSVGGDGIVMESDGTFHYLNELDPEQFTNEMSITRIELSGKQIGNEDLAKLSTLRSIVELNLSETNIDDEGLQLLSELHELTFLNLVGTRIDGSGFKYLTDLPKLCQLIVSRTKINDTGLLNLASMHIIQLTLDDTLVTDASLATLKQMSSLKELNLSNLGISEEQLNELRRELPQCQILP